jgi:hypothetical protein
VCHISRVYNSVCHISRVKYTYIMCLLPYNSIVCICSGIPNILIISFYIVFPAPSSAPRDLTAVALEGNEMAVIVNWQPPSHPNGQIDG